MRILVKPCYDDFLGNKLFDAERARTLGCGLEPQVRLRQAGIERGYEIDTWDIWPIETAHIILFQDLPRRRSELIDVRRRAPGAKLVLMIVESPLARTYAFIRDNHDMFDAIVTYDQRLCDGDRYCRYYLPGVPRTAPPRSVPFGGRRPLVMVNTNSYAGILAHRQSGGLSGLPFLGCRFRGWKVPLKTWLRLSNGEQYSHRRRIARLAEKDFPDVLDMYGQGWQGERMSWSHRFVRNRPFWNAKGRLLGRKTDLLTNYRFTLAFENFAGNFGYISEKLFDALYSGSVPVYLGDDRITDHVPPECFVDARQFRSDREILEFVRDCPKAKWMELREAGEEFLRGPGIKKFESEYYVELILGVFERLVPEGAATASQR